MQAQTRAGVQGPGQAHDAPAPGFGARHQWEKEAQLGEEQCDVFATEDFGNKGAAWFEDMGGNVEGGEEELGLDVLVNVVQPGHVGGTVAHDKVRWLAYACTVHTPTHTHGIIRARAASANIRSGATQDLS